MTDATNATDDQDALLRLLISTGTDTPAVLFDFDGPVCDLFRGAPTDDVAEQVKEMARPYWGWRDPQDQGLLEPEVESCYDSHGILRRLRDMYERPTSKRLSAEPLKRAEEIVTEQESGALRTAVPAPYIVTLVDLLRELRMPLVVVSNNAEGPIRTYLEHPDLHKKFEGVFGRDPHDARLMKPDPHCVLRAIEHLGLPTSSCILIGDQITDLEAARKAGTWFIGYTQEERRAKEMEQGGADAVVSTHLSIIAAAEKFRANR
ncbi:HAD family phosphatase [Streptomyces sp. MBT65]|uniref:HAD family hydrolase n=1 Tax=Streptomyces sp. MBT65 TaxID=1488395 RepID=UPI00190D8499|nr:HAD family phosphatase [Streptomyces sp. MBT65]MBK3580615.1 HAD family phosphatase [Streptomyces sp. MBT65]